MKLRGLLFFIILFSLNGCFISKWINDIKNVKHDYISPSLLEINVEDVKDNEESITIGGAEYLKTFISDSMTLWLDPYTQREDVSRSFAGIEQLQDLNGIIIYGGNYDKVDFSALRLLPKLDGLVISTNRTEGFTRIPDLKGLDLLAYLKIGGADLLSMDGIENLPYLESLDLWDGIAKYTDMSAISQLKNLKICEILGWGDIYFTELSGLENLIKLEIDTSGMVDFTGIEALTNLKELKVFCSSPINTEYLAGVKNLEGLIISIDESVDTIDFLGSLTALSSLEVYGNYIDYDEGVFWDSNMHTPVRVNIIPLKNLVNLQHLALRGCVIENFSILDQLLQLKGVDVINSIFYPKDQNKLQRKDIGIRDEIEITK